ncbi:hypothetical protein HA402_010870, partial [Bradysia odoriphaga]
MDLWGGIILVAIAAVTIYYKFFHKDTESSPKPRHYNGISSNVLRSRLDKRMLWCELEEVKISGVLDVISMTEKVLQESIFELLTSEASFNNSLNVLQEFIITSDQFRTYVGQQDTEVLTSNLQQIQRVSNAFLEDLLKKWADSLYINDIGELINHYAQNEFGVYREYCGNQPHLDHTLQKLRLQEDFVQMMKTIQDNPKFQRLALDSYLMLPMQRITRLPLLMNAIMKKVTFEKEKNRCVQAYENLTKLVHECNEMARETQDSLEVHAIVCKFENVDSAHDALGKFMLKEEFVKYPAETNGNFKVEFSKLSFRKQKPKHCLVVFYTHQIFVFRRRSSGKLELLDAVSTSNANVTIKAFPINSEDVWKEYPHTFLVYFTKEKTFHILGAKQKSQIESWQRKLDVINGSTSTQTIPVLRNFDTLSDT